MRNIDDRILLILPALRIKFLQWFYATCLPIVKIICHISVTIIVPGGERQSSEPRPSGSGRKYPLAYARGSDLRAKAPLPGSMTGDRVGVQRQDDPKP
jgi:hypothetical protein